MVHPTPRAFPFGNANSGIYGFRPHLQRRDREGVSPSSLHPRCLKTKQTLGEAGQSCQEDPQGNARAETPLAYHQRVPQSNELRTVP